MQFHYNQIKYFSYKGKPIKKTADFCLNYMRNYFAKNPEFNVLLISTKLKRLLDKQEQKESKEFFESFRADRKDKVKLEECLYIIDENKIPHSIGFIFMELGNTSFIDLKILTQREFQPKKKSNYTELPEYEELMARTAQVDSTYIPLAENIEPQAVGSLLSSEGKPMDSCTVQEKILIRETGRLDVIPDTVSDILEKLNHKANVILGKTDQQRPYRKAWQIFFMERALEIASQSTCLSRHVGAVFVKDKHEIAASFNGVPPEYPHPTVCLRKQKGAESGGNLSDCPCNHAEANGLAFAARMGASLYGCTVYCTSKPCSQCMGTLAIVKPKAIIYLSDYPHPIASDIAEKCNIPMFTLEEAINLNIT